MMSRYFCRSILKFGLLLFLSMQTMLTAGEASSEEEVNNIACCEDSYKCITSSIKKNAKIIIFCGAAVMASTALVISKINEVENIIGTKLDYQNINTNEDINYLYNCYQAGGAIIFGWSNMECNKPTW